MQSQPVGLMTTLCGRFFTHGGKERVTPCLEPPKKNERRNRWRQQQTDAPDADTAFTFSFSLFLYAI